MTRDDLQCLCALNIDFEAIGLIEPGREQEPYFCTPLGAQYVGRLGVDGIHFILLPGDERVFCVSPMMGGPDTYVLPVAEDLRTFLAYLLFCHGAGPLEQIAWLDETGFRTMVAETEDWADASAFRNARRHALTTMAEAFCLSPADPFAPVKALQAAFDPTCLQFSDEYFDVLGIERA